MKIETGDDLTTESGHKSHKVRTETKPCHENGDSHKARMGTRGKSRRFIKTQKQVFNARDHESSQGPQPLLW